MLNQNDFRRFIKFFGELGYLLDARIITKNERYFLYYIKKARDNWAIIQFTKDLEYKLFAVLLDKMKVSPELLKGLAKLYYKRKPYSFWSRILTMVL